MGWELYRFSLLRNFPFSLSDCQCIILISYWALWRLSEISCGSPGLGGSKVARAPLNLCVPTSLHYIGAPLVLLYTKPVKKEIVTSPQKGNQCWLELIFWINALVMPPRSTVPPNLIIAAAAFPDSTNMSALLTSWNMWLLDFLSSLFWNFSLG